jgi:O-acetyl-ADP-ribose deacetylase (regulator of RNase III)
MGGGGVDGAIHRKGGKKILEECKKIRKLHWPEGLPPGKAVITSGGNLNAAFVIHTVGPIWRGGKNGEPELLEDAYRNSLDLAVSQNLKSIAFPSISTGAYGFPVDLASKIALRTIKKFLEEKDKIGEIVMVLFTDIILETYIRSAKEIFSI